MQPARPRRGVLWLWALLALLAVLQIVRTPFSADLSAFLPDQPDERQRLLIEQIHDGLPSRTLLLAIGGGDAAARAAASTSLAQALRGSGLFDAVNNGEQDGWAGIGEWLVEHRYALSPAITAERFQAEGLREAITEALSLLGTPGGNSLKALIERDPSGETVRIAETLLPARAPRSAHGVWVSRDGDYAVLMAVIRAPGADISAQAAAIAHTQQVFTSFAGSGAQALRLEQSGAPVFAVDSRARIEFEIHALAGAALLLVTGLLWLAFGSARALGSALLPVASGVLAGIACVSLVFGGVHAMTIGFGATLVGESVDYAIYYLIQASAHQSQATGSAGWRGWVRHNWPTVRLGLLTSVCGFAALVFSGFPGLAQLGVFSIAGLAAAALATRYLLPVLVPAGAPATPRRAALGRTVRQALQALQQARRPLRVLALLLGAAAAVLLWQRSDLWQADLTSLSPVPRAALERNETLRADLGGGDSGTLVVVQGPDVETTLQRAEAAAARLEPLLAQGVIGGFDSVTRFLPSQAVQQQRQAALPDTTTLQAALQAATAGGPLPATRLGPFVADVEKARQAAPLSAGQVQGSAHATLATLVDALLLRRADGSASALLPLQPAGDTALDNSVLAQALHGLAGTQLIDTGLELRTLYQRYLHEALSQVLLGAAAVLLLIGLMLRSLPRLAAVCLPLLLAVLLAMGGLAAFGVPLGILHLVGLLLVVALGSNYTLFFDLLQHGGGSDDDTLASLLLANLTTVLAFGLLACSSIPVLSALGRVVMPGALLALLLGAVFARRTV
ncbi:MMPL family transporter [Pseudorhodoferax sp.]|uniref:MMPL family transporter n=1 Tax=Pseudorhodoferax sp. TaxID=1993553 RepID=UPI002DD66A44|nr:MMPL family transporter [Pseudorhodoferax sp.]